MLVIVAVGKAVYIETGQEERNNKAYQTPCMILEGDATRVHHPAIRVTQTVDMKSIGLGPRS